MLFCEITGQQAIKHRLINSVKENRVSHAQLFLGPEGCGKLALAIAYIQYIFCENKRENDACGKCSSCIKMNKLVHPDLHFIYPQIIKKDDASAFLPLWRDTFLKNPYFNLNQWYEQIGMENKQGIISVEDSSSILRKLSLKSFESEYKAVVMWMPEKLQTSAANKLLKILEEPPAKTLFVLVSENYDQLLPTVLSRIQFIKINKLTDDDIRNMLVRQHSVSPIVANQIVYLADGNYNEALSLMMQNNAESEMETELFVKWMRLCFQYKSKTAELISWSEEIAKRGREKQKKFLQYALHLINQCLLLKYGETSLCKLNDKEMEFTQKFIPFIHRKNREQFAEELNNAYFHIERNAYPKILFLDLSFKIGKLLQTKML